MSNKYDDQLRNIEDQITCCEALIVTLKKELYELKIKQLTETLEAYESRISSDQINQLQLELSKDENPSVLAEKLIDEVVSDGTSVTEAIEKVSEENEDTELLSDETPDVTPVEENEDAPKKTRKKTQKKEKSADAPKRTFGTINCEVCGKEFVRRYPRQKVCDECSGK